MKTPKELDNFGNDSFSGWRVDIDFYSPVAFERPPMFDSIVGYASARDRFWWAQVKSPHTIRWLSRFYDRMPELFSMVDSVPLASQMQFDTVATFESLESWKKRFDTAQRYSRLVDFGKSRRRVDTGGGPFRNYNMPLQVQVANKGWFFFIGNGEKIEKLFSQWVFGIGKKVGTGYGAINKAVFTPVELGVVDILSNRGPIPVEIADRYGIIGHRLHAGFRPPYWLPEHKVECIQPS